MKTAAAHSAFVNWSGCEAISLRLKRGENAYTYMRDCKRGDGRGADGKPMERAERP